MSRIIAAIFLTLRLAAGSYTGFCHGAFWDSNTPKTYEDFHKSFEAYNSLPNIHTDLGSKSARLFTSVEWKTKNNPIPAFKAAIDTNTNLLIGIWIPSIDDELLALGKALTEHGSKLADLVIGVVVGNEDMLRDYTVERIHAAIVKFRDWTNNNQNGQLLRDKPVGHSEPSTKVTYIPDLDFLGANVHPWWSRVSIDNVKADFQALMGKAREKANGLDIWITEIGWPSSGGSVGAAEASNSNLETLWNEIRCKELFRQTNTWWFELEKDTSSDGPSEDLNLDWGVIDRTTRQPRFSDFGCPGMAFVEVSEGGKEEIPQEQAEAPPRKEVDGLMEEQPEGETQSAS